MFLTPHEVYAKLPGNNTVVRQFYELRNFSLYSVANLAYNTVAEVRNSSSFECNIRFSWLAVPRLLLLGVTTQPRSSQWEGENLQVAEVVLVLLSLLQQEVDTVGKSVEQRLSISSLSEGEYILA